MPLLRRLILGRRWVHSTMKPQSERFCAEFGLAYPIIQAPMAGASTVQLAASVTNLGGMGSIPLGSHPHEPKVVEKKVTEYRYKVHKDKQGCVNLNFFTHEEPVRDKSKDEAWLKKYEDLYKEAKIEAECVNRMKLLYPSFKSVIDPDHPTVRALLSLKPSIVSFHFGLPELTVLKSLQKGGISVFVTATNLEEVQLCNEAGVDGVVLQGWEAGGHRGNFFANDTEDPQLSTEQLVDAVVEYFEGFTDATVPYVIAAGGIYSSAQINEYLAKGIAGVQLGTVWLPTDEATISQQHFEYVQESQGRKTFMTPAISGRNLRTIETGFLKTLSQAPVSEIPDYPLPYYVFKRLGTDTKSKGPEYASFLAGSNYDKSWKGTRSVTEVFQDLVQDIPKH